MMMHTSKPLSVERRPCDSSTGSVMHVFYAHIGFMDQDQASREPDNRPLIRARSGQQALFVIKLPHANVDTMIALWNAATTDQRRPVGVRSSWWRTRDTLAIYDHFNDETKLVTDDTAFLDGLAVELRQHGIPEVATPGSKVEEFLKAAPLGPALFCPDCTWTTDSPGEI